MLGFQIADVERGVCIRGRDAGVGSMSGKPEGGENGKD